MQEAALVVYVWPFPVPGTWPKDFWYFLALHQTAYKRLKCFALYLSQAFSALLNALSHSFAILRFFFTSSAFYTPVGMKIKTNNSMISKPESRNIRYWLGSGWTPIIQLLASFARILWFREKLVSYHGFILFVQWQNYEDWIRNQHFFTSFRVFLI